MAADLDVLAPLSVVRVARCELLGDPKVDLGELAVAAGDLPAARTAFQTSLDIRAGLAASDPSNTAWQRDLSISHERLGGLAVAAGDLPAAREHYEIDLRIAEELASLDPDNVRWRKDLEISRQRMIGITNSRSPEQAAHDPGEGQAGDEPDTTAEHGARSNGATERRS